MEDNTALTISLYPDIEKLDEPRFFYVELLEYDGIDYNNSIIIEDPFAFAIVNLDVMKALYNSHGEDGVEKRYKIKSTKTCIGKIHRRKLMLDDCTIDF